MNKKLQLIYLPIKDASCIPHPHYDLCTDEENPENIACILTNNNGAKLIKSLIKRHNKEIINGN